MVGTPATTVEEGHAAPPRLIYPKLETQRQLRVDPPSARWRSR